MPSGAKKRKAAKKKKENQNQSNNHSDSAPAPAHSHGDEYVKHQDDRERNVGDVSSPTSQDHHQKLPVKAKAEGAFSMEGSRIGNGEEQVGVEKEIKIENASGVKDSIIDHDEANWKPYDGGSSGSCGGSSSSDDEGRGINKGQAELSIASGVSVEMDDSLSGNTVEPVCDPIVENISAAIESDVLSQAAISVAPRVVESTLKENGVEKFGCVEERICMSMEEADVGSPKTLDPKECVTQENDDRSLSPAVALDNGAECVKGSVVTEPVVAHSPYPVQKTSWKSCCGLFQVFTGGD